MTDAVRTFRFPAIDRVVHGAGRGGRGPGAGRRARRDAGADRDRAARSRSRRRSSRALEAALGDRHRATFARMRAHAPRADIDDAIAAVHETGADLLVGYGGSSVTDATKIVAVRARRRRDPAGARADHAVERGVDARRRA